MWWEELWISPHLWLCWMENYSQQKPELCLQLRLHGSKAGAGVDGS